MRQARPLPLLSRYHSGMLIVKTKAAAATVPMGGVMTSAFTPRSHGLLALDFYERSGRLRRVRPLYRHATLKPHVASFAGLLDLTTVVRTPEDPLNGVSMIEIDNDANVDELRSALALDPTVESVSRVPVRYLVAGSSPTIVEAIPPPASKLWNLAKIDWAQARSAAGFEDAVDMNVAVLDTGVDGSHPDLQGRVVQYTHGYPDLGVSASDQDIVGHGTHVSGIISALINNNIGINGICQCRLNIWKIFSDTPEYIPEYNEFTYVVDSALYLRALADCVQQHMSAINLSIGGGMPPDPSEASLFQQLVSNGTAVVAAMGNDRQSGSPTSYPAAIPGVIAVGSTGLDDSVSVFSNAGPHICLAAPGEGIWSTLPTYPGQTGFQVVAGPGGQPSPGAPIPRDTDYASWDGTSMATPHVTGSVALYLVRHPGTGPDAMKTALQLGADKVPGMNGAAFSVDYGAGRLNLETLLQ